MNLGKKRELLQKRRWRIRKKIVGTQSRPRLTVRFTNKNIHAQCIDDESSNTLLAVSTNEKDLKSCLPMQMVHKEYLIFAAKFFLFLCVELNEETSLQDKS